MYGFNNIFHIDIMKNLIENIHRGNINHAYIFQGNEGLFKKDAARLIACSVLCRNQFSAPCGVCSQCTTVKAGTSPDIKIINKGKAKSISVEKVRDEIVNDILIKPFAADYKVYIVEDAHTMTESAQNAFLKVLEEPPSYAVFILTVSDMELMCRTIISRCAIIRFPPLSDKVILDYISSKYPDTENKDLIVNFCEGIPKNADIIISDPDFEIIRNKLVDMTALLFSVKNYDAFKIADFFDIYSDNAAMLLSMWQKLLRDIVLIQENSNILINSDLKDELKHFALYTDEKKTVYAAVQLTESMQMAKRYVKLRSNILAFVLSVKKLK